jgi:hypothetical protein
MMLAQSANTIAGAMLIPNPVEDKADLVFETPTRDELQIVIKDLTGKIVYQTRSDFRHEDCYKIPLDLDFIRKGIYILQVSGTSGRIKTIRLQKT